MRPRGGTMRNLKLLNPLAALCAAVLLAACGSGQLSTQGNGGGAVDDDADPGATPPASLTLLASSPQLASDASAVTAGVTLTAIVKDANNNVLPGITVVFSTSDSGEIVVTNPAQTDETGRVTAVLTTGGDPQNRSITVRATAQDLTRTVTIVVVGSSISISGPINTQFGVSTPYSVLLTDAGGNGISGQAIELETNPENTLAVNTNVTDASGKVDFTLTPSVANSFVRASALGLTETLNVAVSTDQFEILTPAANQEISIGTAETVTVRWLQSGSPVPNGTQVNFVATRGTLSAPNAQTVNGQASVQLSSSQSGFSTLVASSDALTRPSIQKTVEFVATTPGNLTLQVNPSTVSASQSADITAVVRDNSNNLVKNANVNFTLQDQTGGTLSSPTAVTNSQGVARTTYTASSQSSGTDSVQVSATVANTAISDTANLTVGGRATRIAFGTGASLLVKDESTYQMPFTVLVSDSAGNPVSDADFRLTVFPVRFYKGNRNNRTACDNEDINSNDILDPGEDTNSNGALEPGRVSSVPATVELNPDDGSGQFLMTYPKEFGQFIDVRITATVVVAGTETTVSRIIALTVTETDAPSLPFDSPFGTVLDCSSAA